MKRIPGWFGVPRSSALRFGQLVELLCRFAGDMAVEKQDAAASCRYILFVAEHELIGALRVSQQLDVPQQHIAALLEPADGLLSFLVFDDGRQLLGVGRPIAIHHERAVVEQAELVQAALGGSTAAAAPTAAVATAAHNGEQGRGATTYPEPSIHNQTPRIDTVSLRLDALEDEVHASAVRSLRGELLRPGLI